VDIIGFSPLEIADRIVDDLCDPSVHPNLAPHTFNAAYHPRQASNSIRDSL